MSHSRIWQRQKLEKCLSTWFILSCCLWNPEAMWRRQGWSARCWTRVAHISLPKFSSRSEVSSSWVSQPINFPCVCVCVCVCVCASVTLCGPMDCSPPGSFVHGILQTKIWKWVAIAFCRGSSHPGIKPGYPYLQADSLPSEPQWKPQTFHSWALFLELKLQNQVGC